MKINKPQLINGKRHYLKCFYDPERCNYDEVISRALDKFKLKAGHVPVLCLPKKGADESEK